MCVLFAVASLYYGLGVVVCSGLMAAAWIQASTALGFWNDSLFIHEHSSPEDSGVGIRSSLTKLHVLHTSSLILVPRHNALQCSSLFLGASSLS